MKSINLITLLVIFILTSIQNVFCKSNLDSVYVPIDYDKLNGEKFYLYYEFGSKYNPSLPTVFAIADGQQFWARPGRAARFQKETFGNKMNVLVLFGRSMNNLIDSYLRDKNGEIEWQQAYRLFKSDQWIEDIESVRKAVDPNKKINLYGRSGGGLLLLQYLKKYGDNVEKAFCQTALVPNLESILGFRHDRLWEEIIEYDEVLGDKLLKSIEENYFEKDDIILTLQRQNFFVESKQIGKEREMLINALFENNSVVFDSLKIEYQVEAVKGMSSTSLGISSNVREYEFFMNDYYDIMQENKTVVRVDIEAVKFYAKPLINEYEKGNVPRPTNDFSNFHNLNTQVFIFAARWDHTVDYRGQYYLTGLIPKSILFLVNDNHVFSTIYNTDNYSKIVQYALLFDKSSNEMKIFLEETSSLRWHEWKSE